MVKLPIPKWTERMTYACERAIDFRERLDVNLTFAEEIDMMKIVKRAPQRVPKQFRGKIRFEKP